MNGEKTNSIEDRLLVYKPRYWHEMAKTGRGNYIAQNQNHSSVIINTYYYDHTDHTGRVWYVGVRK